jgi:hypothetical protein
MTNSNEQVHELKNINEIENENDKNDTVITKPKIEGKKIPSMSLRIILLLVGSLQTFFCAG